MVHMILIISFTFSVGGASCPVDFARRQGFLLRSTHVSLLDPGNQCTCILEKWYYKAQQGLVSHSAWGREDSESIRRSGYRGAGHFNTQGVPHGLQAFDDNSQSGTQMPWPPLLGTIVIKVVSEQA